MYRIENTIVERLKERDLNAIDLLQEYAKNNRKQTGTIKVTYQIDNKTREKLIEIGIDDMEEVRAAIQRCLGEFGDAIIIEEQC